MNNLKHNKLTVFTPTFNRAHLLPRLYESLCMQTNKNFIWLIIDDGSRDNTEYLVKGWISKNLVDIQYHYKTNGGMHTAHNLAYSLIETELNTCIDSDDYLPVNAVELIIENWNNIIDKTNIAGIIGLDADQQGSIIGSKIPNNLSRGTLSDLYLKHGVTGDKKIVIRTEIIKEFPKYPEYTGEKLVPLGALYILIGKKFDFLYSNDILCIVEYQNEGSSKTIFRQYAQSPKGFAYARKISINNEAGLINKFKNYTHLISSSLFAKDISVAFIGVNFFGSLIALPSGLLLYVYIVYKNKFS
ncbi:glycosyltransferase family 2 protein [Aequorivita echinoideorum]|uniref:Glycosyltransferase family 2 protein n=1 Tax=Aequorivita echinoideorum TaxID=1549647 RepID=A0ABS5S7T4_9FLAO|nr:glycosyltransferase family 2 protein [Aequorivita echinoideorum]MBT0607930.1 glycosyltransferase family 2 protein [Aequorivita echinoideorum]